MNFASYHPALNLLFFVAVIAFTACWTHPGLAAVSFLCALAYSARLRGPRAVAFGCALIAAALAFAALFALNVHFGVTNLARTPIDNSITVESLTCGIIVGIKVAAILVWLSCVMCVFTADKVVFLLGRVFPKAAKSCAGERRTRSTGSTTGTARLSLSLWRLSPCAPHRRRSARRKCSSAPSSCCRRRRLRALPSLRRFLRCAFCRSRFKWPAKPPMREERKL